MKPEQEDQRVRDVLRYLIRASGRTIVDVSSSAGMGRRYLYQLLGGNQEIKLIQVLQVIEELGVEPRELWDLLATGEPKPARAAAPRTGGRADLEYIGRRIREEGEKDLRALVREIVEEELGPRRRKDG